MSTCSLSADFWKEFHSKYWEKIPGLFKNLFDKPFLSQEHLFDAIVGMTSRTPADRFWASRQIPPQTRDDFQTVDLDQHGPKRQDQSLGGFFARARSQIGDLPIGLNIHQLEKAQPSIWFKFREFVHELNKIAGELPSGRWDIDTFLGNYQISPLGIHHDNASVFAIGVMGHRSYYTWPAEYFNIGDAALDTLNIEKIQTHLNQAVRIDVGPGDMVYWPSSNWHFVTSNGQPSAVISVSAYFGKNLSEVVADQFKELLATHLKNKDFNRKYTFEKDLTNTPRQLKDMITVVEKTANNGQIVDALQKYWLTFYSTDGLHPVLKNNNVTLDLQDMISVDPRFPVIWKKINDDELLISANGHLHAMQSPGYMEIINVLELLNCGKSISVSDLADKFSLNAISKQFIVDLLNTLHIFRAFNVY